MSRRVNILALALPTTLLGAFLCVSLPAQETAVRQRKVVKTDAEWKKLLTPSQYMVTRLKETEPAFSGKYATSHAKGTFACVCCGAPLFSSQTKFDSGTGWPSFWRPIDPKKIDSAPDFHTGEQRIEVMCNDCGAHLGHVFDDGPPPTGLRYCINSLSLKLVTPAAAAAAAKKSSTSKAKDKDKDKEKTDPPSAESSDTDKEKSAPAEKKDTTEK